LLSEVVAMRPEIVAMRPEIVPRGVEMGHRGLLFVRLCLMASRWEFLEARIA
jgi:hypothetical protein